MKIILITGGRRAGKSHILLYTAKVLANAGFKVLAADATIDGDILSFFNINYSLEDRFKLDGSSVITREGFDIMAPGMQLDADLLEPQEADKDFILIETDRVLSIPPYVPVQTVLVQDMDKENLYSLKAITHQNLKNNTEMPACILINNYIRCKLSLKYICHTLSTSPEQLYIIPMDIRNTAKALNNRVDGRLSLKGFTTEHNRSVFSLACEVSEIENNRKNFKKYAY
ncbi:MAG: hypothetical protein FIA99_04360 [Ruminiclostridium sp.]|nr:hypothetical protein [Ruminiclostridium sp.]